MRTIRLVSPALRALAWFWATLVVVVVGTVVGLQLRGPPQPKLATAVAPSPLVPLLPRPQPVVAREPAPEAATGAIAIAPPDPALEEPAPDYVGAVLPRIGSDGRTPMRIYAAPAAAADGRSRIALLLTGIGLSAAEDDDAVDSLPPAVSFAVSPYSYRPDALLQRLRARGHEVFVSLPMEPRGFPVDDPGPEALLTGNIEAVNQQRFEWAMSRIAGYVGVTGAMGALRGERFGGSSTQMAPVLRELGSRGLMYVESRVGAPRAPGVMERSVNVVVDALETRSDIDARLAELEVLAHDHGTALGLAGPPHPVTVARLASWAATLPARGFVLVPVSAVVAMELSEAAAGTAKP